jgi:NAD(P)-dependent dehydrogenase (short-subunit alcohol dehydrogenase family)
MGSLGEAPIIVVTGATSGIGRATALGLAARRVDLVLPVRDRSRGEEVAALARRAGAASAEVIDCDLSLMSSVHAAATEFKRRHSRLDVLINDAAVFLGDRSVTSEGHERMFATNYLGPFVLTNLLLGELAAAAPSRVINVTAPATTAPDVDDLDSERGFKPATAFGRSTAAKLLFTYALARRLEPRGVSVFAYHPGVARTQLMREAPAAMRLFGAVLSITARTPERAAAGLIDLALSPGLEGLSGRLVHDGEAIRAPFIDDLDAQERLWTASEKLTGIAL